MIRVLVADDHHLVREGIVALLERADDMLVVAQAADGEEAVALARTESPDVVVMDVTMPRLNGIQAIERLREEGITVPVVMLTIHHDDAIVQRALAAGANGFVPKQAVTDELLLAIRAASHGATFLSPSVSRAVRSNSVEPGRAPVTTLTGREHEILALVAHGLTSRSVARELGISTRTVERHRTHLMTKLGVGNVVELVREAVRLRLIELGEVAVDE